MIDRSEAKAFSFHLATDVQKGIRLPKDTLFNFHLAGVLFESAVKNLTYATKDVFGDQDVGNLARGTVFALLIRDTVFEIVEEG